MLPALFKPRPYLYKAHYEGVLGTSLTLQALARDWRHARAAEAATLAEIERLERIFSSFLPDSELSSWQALGTAQVSAELRGLLHRAESWMARTYGVFNPAAAALQRLYQQNPHPNEAELSVLREALQDPLWQLRGEVAHKLTPLPLTFNALAKGHIADCAAQAAVAKGALQVLLNLGGDIRHIGPQSVQVAVADPFAQADNAPPLARLTICNQGIATSGRSQRGAHLFDPRMATTVDRMMQATVVAPDAATADVLATVFCVLEPGQSLALAEELGVGSLLVGADGQVHTNLRFAQHESEVIG